MSLNSLSFLIFLGFVLLLYYIVPKKAQWIVLLIASYSFYLFSGIKHVFFIIATTLFTYGASHLMQHMRDKSNEKIKAMGEDVTREQKLEIKKATAKKIHSIQVATVLINLAVLACVKYLNFFIQNTNELFTMFKYDFSIPFINIIVPLGISYYTFNSIGYLIDVGRGKIKAERHFGHFALFVSFFPSIIQGPLNKYSDLATQFKAPHPLKYNNLKFGMQLILWGIFKKMVIADRVAIISTTIFSKTFGDYTGSHIVLAVLAYSLQIYCDFSGGIDITRGVAQMMDINLPLNFERPFFATSMADFWRRWHMSLGAWMREYVFYPIMLSKPVTYVSKKFRKKFGSYAGKIVPSVAAPMVVFFLIGIWHGISKQYITNGLYNALIISSSVALAPVYKKLTEICKVDPDSFSFRLFQMLRTFLLLCISRIIVRAPSLRAAFYMIKSVFTDLDIPYLLGVDGKIFELGMTPKDFTLIFVCILILLVIGILQENGVKIRETIAKQNIFFRWTIMFLLIGFILLFGMYGTGYDASAFIYGGF